MNNRKFILWGTMAASLVFIIPQVFILLALGLSPTVVAFIVDKSKSKYAAFSVGGMNVAGVTPSLLELWNGKNNVSGAMDILTGLSKWIGGQMGPIIKFYQSRSTQKHLETEVPKIVRDGNLSELLELLDNPETRLTDASEYEIAIEAFRVAQDEIKKVEHDMGPNSDIALLASRKVASVTSVVIMTFVIVVMFIAG